MTFYGFFVVEYDFDTKLRMDVRTVHKHKRGLSSFYDIFENTHVFDVFLYENLV